MKRILFLLIILSYSASLIANKKETNWDDVTFRHNDKDPYGCYLAYNILDTFLLCDNNIKNTKTIFETQDWYYNEDSTNNQQLKFIIGNSIKFGSVEFDKILNYLRCGNSMVIAAEEIDLDILKKFGFKTIYSNYENPEMKKHYDSLNMNNYYEKFVYAQSIITPIDTFVFEKGYLLNSYLKFDTSSISVDTNLDYDKFIFPYKEISKHSLIGTNCVVGYYGKGKIILCTAPKLFTNYFLLQKNNREYFTYVLSFLPKKYKNIYWHQFYNKQPDSEDKGGEGLSGLLKYPMWRWALILALLGIFLFILVNSKRKYRAMQPTEELKNNSLEFIQTLGALYYDKQDHRNIAEKMITHFLENIRSKYKLHTNILDEDFAKKLAHKSGKNIGLITNLFEEINLVKNVDTYTEQNLVNLYNKINEFK